jgi:hypothetical protein
MKTYIDCHDFSLIMKTIRYNESLPRVFNGNKKKYKLEIFSKTKLPDPKQVIMKNWCLILDYIIQRQKRGDSRLKTIKLLNSNVEHNQLIERCNGENFLKII